MEHFFSVNTMIKELDYCSGCASVVQVTVMVVV